jgi:hypothetical protein
MSCRCCSYVSTRLVFEYALSLVSLKATLAVWSFPVHLTVTFACSEERCPVLLCSKSASKRLSLTRDTFRNGSRACLVDDPSCESVAVADAKGGYDVYTGAMTDLFRNNEKPREFCDDLAELLHKEKN